MKITCKLTADSKQLIRKMGRFSRTLLTHVVQATDTVGGILVNGSRQTIDMQDFTPLNEEWRDFKGKHGYDEGILKMIGLIQSQITYKRLFTSGYRVSGHVGYLDSAMHPLLGYGNAAGVTKKHRENFLKKRFRGNKRYSAVQTATLVKWQGTGSYGGPPRAFFSSTAKRLEKQVYSTYAAAVGSAWASM